MPAALPLPAAGAHLPHREGSDLSHGPVSFHSVYMWAGAPCINAASHPQGGECWAGTAWAHAGLGDIQAASSCGCSLVVISGRVVSVQSVPWHCRSISNGHHLCPGTCWLAVCICAVLVVLITRAVCYFSLQDRTKNEAQLQPFSPYRSSSHRFSLASPKFGQAVGSQHERLLLFCMQTCT